MNKQRLIQVLKLVAVGLLFWFVFSKVQWHDRMTVLDAAGKEVETFSGEIVGPWDAKKFEFRVEGEEQARVYDSEPDDAGRRSAAVPGFLTYVRNVDPLWFALGAACYVIALVIAAGRWWWLLRANGLAVSLPEAIRFTWIGVFFNNVVPGQTGGDVIKALYIVKHCPDGRVEALMSVIVDRILGLGSLALLGAVVVLFDVERFAEIAIGIWAVLALVLGIGVVAFSRRIRRTIKLDQLLRRLPPKIAGPLMKVDSAIFFYRNHKGGILAWLLIGVVNHGFTVLSFLLIGTSLGVGLPPLEYFVLVPVILMVSAVPLGPNGWGVGEWMFGGLFGHYGAVHLQGVVPDPETVMRTRGVALSVLYRLHTTAWSLVGGAMVLFDRDRVTRAEFEAELEREEQEGQAALTEESRADTGG